jgi:hypothetical protein
VTFLKSMTTTKLYNSPPLPVSIYTPSYPTTPTSPHNTLSMTSSHTLPHPTPHPHPTTHPTTHTSTSMIFNPHPHTLFYFPTFCIHYKYINISLYL